MKNKKKILITGGCGYVGTSLIDYLIKLDFEIICLDLMIYGDKSIKSFSKYNNIKFYKEDIRKTEIIEKYFTDLDYVIHLAAIVGDKPCESAPEVAYDINFNSTKEIFNLSKKYNIKKFIFASTCSNYGISDPNIFASEDSKLNPVSLYAETKIDCEKYLSENSDDKMKIVCLRFGTAFGVSKRTRFDLTINSFVFEALKKKKIYLYAPNSWRPYIHVNDMAKIILKFIQSSSKSLKPFDIFNAGFTKNNFTKIQIFSKILRNFQNLNYEVIESIEDPRNYKVSFEKIENKLNLEPPISIEDGIRDIQSAFADRLITDQDFESFNLESVTRFFTAKGNELKIN